MAERPDCFISPARSISGPGISAALRGTSTWLWVSIPIVFATISATCGSDVSAAQLQRGRRTVAAPAVVAIAVRNWRLDEFAREFIRLLMSARQSARRE